MITLTSPWTCHICGQLRPDNRIDINRQDISGEYGLPPGTMWQNVRHCNDNPECIKQAESFRFSKAKRPQSGA